MAHEQHCWTVLCSDHNRNAFIRCIDRNNIFGSYYHIREPETQQLQMQFYDYAECAAKWESKTALFNVSTLALPHFIGDHLPTLSCPMCLHYLAQCAYLVLPNVRYTVSCKNMLQLTMLLLLWTEAPHLTCTTDYTFGMCKSVPEHSGPCTAQRRPVLVQQSCNASHFQA